MADPRRSYRRTLIAVGLAETGLVVALAVGLWQAGTAASPAWRLAAAGLGLALLCAAALLALVLAGGVIALRRTRLEDRGLPYPPPPRREWLPGPALAALRRRWGRLRSSRDGRRLHLRAGDPVVVRDLEEIRATLDSRGTLDGLPFMPEMAAWCGREAVVFRRAEKINDWVWQTGVRRLRDTVLLAAVRCGGEAHGGCQAACHILWKEAWLRRESDPTPAAPRAAAPPDPAQHTSRTDPASGETVFVCQATELVRATEPMTWGDPRHYLRDLVTGNVRPGPWLTGVTIALFNRFQTWRGGVRYPFRATSDDPRTPTASLGLQPGELVRVRSKREIAPTLSPGYRNRGLWFDADMLRFCGGEYRVAARIDRLIEEKTGRLLRMGNPCIHLEGVLATGEYLAFCPQNELIYWREIWLERVGRPDADAAAPGTPAT